MKEMCPYLILQVSCYVCQEASVHTMSGLDNHVLVSLFPPEITNPGQRRDALRFLCLLLPQANRDTLQELLQFLSRVALHSDGIILIDGTEVCVCVCLKVYHCV